MGKNARKFSNWSADKKKAKFEGEIKDVQKRYSSIDSSTVTTFSDLPLSENTLKGLKDSNYIIPTDIQKESIGLGLQGRDILGAAETGSGKTLAFLIPILESLYVKKWTRLDGVGAMIITPTRELAYQIFETLKKIGVYHDFSAGLVIGGKDLHFEKDRMDQCNIIICTPGRILHHMDTNPLFDCSSLHILVLDEADRCLDMGFENAMNGIIENLPKTRQTLLFSATQTKSIKELARLSLKTPAYVSVHENKKHTTPDSLEQSYILCHLEDKINLLWSFVKNHRRQKILVFLSSCKQVKYLYSIFCRLRPGTPLLALYGTLHQLRRMNIYKEFCSKQNVVMFATDIAARGLDFPEVNWVVQMDCPEDANTYIHRAGRTARYRKGGESLLVLLPSEEKFMLQELDSKRVPVTKIEVNHCKLMSPIRKIEALLARDPELKAEAQRCFLAYIKSIYLMKNKNIFSVENINLKSFAASLGLAVTPRVRFLNKIQGNSADRGENQGEADNEWEKEENDPLGKPDVERMPDKPIREDDGFLTLKRKDHELPAESFPTESEHGLSKKQHKKAVLTKVAVAKKVLKKKIVANKKVIFTDDGEVIEQQGKEKFTEVARAYENEELAGLDISKAREILKAEDKFDKKLYRERVKQKHKEAKKKAKQQKKGVDEELSDMDGTFDETDVRLGGSSDIGDDYEPDTSWIPDPDKIYGKESSNDAQYGDEDEGINLKRKKKRVSVKNQGKKRKMADHDFSTGLTLKEDEEIALKILQFSR